MEAFAIPDAKQRLTEAVDALVSEFIDGFSTQALGEDLVDLRRAADRLEAEFLRRLDRFDRAHGALADGAGSTACGGARADCVDDLEGWCVPRPAGAGPSASCLPVSTAPWAGRASLGNVTMIAQLANDVGVEQVAALEHILVGAAETLDLDGMRTVTQVARLRIDPDGVLADDNRAHERRWFECEQTYGGVFVLRGELDAEGGALVKTAIDALSHGLNRDETRTGSQRRADALVDLAATQLRCGDHRDVHGQRPHLTLTVSADTLRGDADGWPAELRGVGPIHPETARRIACDAALTVVAVAPPADGGSAWTGSRPPVLPLAVGRETRTIPAHLRTALNLRDQGCRFPGCDRPPAWTDGHHIIHWPDGPTELHNLVSLCRTHHRRVHEQGWRIHIADGLAVVEPPP